MTLLSDLAIKKAKIEPKEYTLKDGDGLFVNIHPNGSKYFLFRFSWLGKQTRISFGKYPELGLKEARNYRNTAREALAKGLDPRVISYSSQSDSTLTEDCVTFDTFANLWLKFKLKKLNARPSKEKKNKGRGSTETQIERAFNNDLFPTLRGKPLKQVSRTDLLAIIKNIENRKALSVSEKVKSWLKEIFSYAVATGELDSNPAADLDVASLPYRRNKHYPYLKMEDIPELMAKLNFYRGDRQTILGLRLLLLTGIRTGELRFSEPWQYDLEAGVLNIPASDVKQLQQVINRVDANVPDYIVPLSKQAIAIVQELLSYCMPGQRYLFSHRSNPRESISENTLNGALKRMGFKSKLCPHGIRATISTALNEKKYDKDFIEAQLSHTGEDKVRATYNHANYVEMRRQMMQDWADMIDGWEKEGLERL